MTETETLLPCPLCGSTNVTCFAQYDGDSYENEPVYYAVVGCLGCREEGCDPSYDDEPCFGIEAYFPGSHPLIKDCEDPEDCERVITRHMAERWNRRAESTCRNVSEYGSNDNSNDFGFRCSECGAWVDSDEMGYSPLCVEQDYKPLRFCPNCGAKVVDE